MDQRIETLQERIFELETQVEVLESLVLKLIERETTLHHEWEYVFLKQELPIEKRYDLSFFMVRLEKAYQAEGQVPTLLAFHEELKQVLELNELAIDVSTRLIEEYRQRGVFDVGERIIES